MAGIRLKFAFQCRFFLGFTKQNADKAKRITAVI